MASKDNVTSLQQRSLYCLEAEQATLGGLMLDNSAWPKVASIVTEEDFYRAEHQLIFQGIRGLAAEGRPFDVVTLLEWLESHGQLENAGDSSYLGMLARDTPSAANITAYAEIVKKRSTRRKLIRLGNQIADLAHNDDPAEALVQASVEIDRIKAAISYKSKNRFAGIISADVFAKMEFPPIRWAVEGILPAGVTLLAGPPKIGKSRLAFNIGYAVASGGMALGSIPVEPGEVLYIALDDPKRRLHDMLLSTAQQTGFSPSSRLYLTFEWDRIGNDGIVLLDEWLSEHPACRQVNIDVLKHFRPLPSGKNSNWYLEDYAVGDALKPLAQKYNVAILVNHHTNKLAYRLAEGDDPVQAISGTTGLPGGFDNILVLHKRMGQADAFLHIQGNDTATEDKALIWDNHLLTWRIAGSAEEFAGSTEWLAIRAILEKHGPATAIEVARLRFPNLEISTESKEYKATYKLLSKNQQQGKLKYRFFDRCYMLSKYLT